MEKTAIYLKVIGIVSVIALIVAWQIYLHWHIFRPVQVQAFTGNAIMERVTTQIMPFGTIYVYADVNTRIGYAAVTNHEGILYSWERMTNVMGEPQRFDSSGNVIDRLEHENWFMEGRLELGEVRARITGSLIGSCGHGPIELHFSNAWVTFEDFTLELAGDNIYDDWRHHRPNIYPSVFPNQ